MYEKLSKKALKNMYIAAIIAAALGLIADGAFVVLLFIPDGMTIANVIAGVLAIFIIIWTIVSPVFRYHRYRYKIDEESIDIVEGYFYTQRNIVPIERIHKIQILRGPIDKMCGVAKVNVTTAGGDVTIRFLEVEKAEAIVESLKNRINDIAREN